MKPISIATLTLAGACLALQVAAQTPAASGGKTGAAATETLSSGVGIRHTTVGTGTSPTASDTVKVHYRGTLADGKEFDSSYKRGQPTTFPLNRVVPCWTAGNPAPEGGWQGDADLPADDGLWIARRAQCHPARQHVDLRSRVAVHRTLSLGRATFLWRAALQRERRDLPRACHRQSPLGHSQGAGRAGRDAASGGVAGNARGDGNRTGRCRLAGSRSARLPAGQGPAPVRAPGQHGRRLRRRLRLHQHVHPCSLRQVFAGSGFLRMVQPRTARGAVRAVDGQPAGRQGTGDARADRTRGFLCDHRFALPHGELHDEREAARS